MTEPESKANTVGKFKTNSVQKLEGIIQFGFFGEFLNAKIDVLKKQFFVDLMDKQHFESGQMNINAKFYWAMTDHS